MGRKRAFGWRARIAAALLLAGGAGGGWAWWQAQHWRPDPKEFPVQGVLIGAEDGAVSFTALHAIGASFAYIEASAGAETRDRDFPHNVRAAREAGLNVGPVHRYDPCLTAEVQSANFMTIVPRDAKMLPPAIALDTVADACPRRVSEAMVESELMTFLNQVEGHAGQPAVLELSPAFEDKYHLAARLERNLWLARDWFQPDYGGRPWTLWTANAHYRNEASEEPVRWVVVQP